MRVRTSDRRGQLSELSFDTDLLLHTLVGLLLLLAVSLGCSDHEKNGQ
jgi:hypothetical protein